MVGLGSSKSNTNCYRNVWFHDNPFWDISASQDQGHDWQYVWFYTFFRHSLRFFWVLSINIFLFFTGLEQSLSSRHLKHAGPNGFAIEAVPLKFQDSVDEETMPLSLPKAGNGYLKEGSLLRYKDNNIVWKKFAGNSWQESHENIFVHNAQKWLVDRCRTGVGGFTSSGSKGRDPNIKPLDRSRSHVISCWLPSFWVMISWEGGRLSGQSSGNVFLGKRCGVF
jgi:hypothetical protein